MREMHHRVSNNLDVIDSLLDAQLDAYKKGDRSKSFEELVVSAKERISAMAVVHQQLRNKKSYDHVFLNEFVPQIVESVLLAYKSLTGEVNLSIDVDRVKIDVDRSVSVGLIINELVSNACKHAFKNNPRPKIDVSILKNKSRLIIKVADNGNGLESGFEVKKDGSLGHQIIEMLVQELRGNMEIISENGAIFCIVVPGSNT